MSLEQEVKSKKRSFGYKLEIIIINVETHVMMYTVGDFNTHTLVLRRQEDRVDGTENADCVKIASVIRSVFLYRKATVSNRIGHPTPSWVSR